LDTLSNRQINRGIAYITVSLCLAVSFTACSTQTEWPRQSIPGPATALPSAPVATPASVAEPSRSVTAPSRTVTAPSRSVTASYQGSGTAGQTTASGEPYNPNALTAASRNLPIGSIVRVTNPETGRSVKVRINDRGPMVHRRSLDLSKGAAEKIGITHKGVARVKLAVVKSHPASVEPESPSSVNAPASPMP
jgi:rare lipoprotein A